MNYVNQMPIPEANCFICQRPTMDHPNSKHARIIRFKLWEFKLNKLWRRTCCR